mmetsp:Transcript_33658/g.110151  ORF Transcript_33658/g.110151 Transcript_33658/m.110151 type:complete len:488 (+) Transcript_33658:62-1525(+)
MSLLCMATWRSTWSSTSSAGPKSVAGWASVSPLWLRPLGGLLIGVVGDRFGRSKAVNISIVGMLVGTVGQGLVPTYSSGNETLGHIGFVLLIILRFVQGLSAAGEIGTISTYLTEVASHHLLCRGIALIAITCNLGILAAQFVVYAITRALGEEAVKAWAWRLSFLLALIPGLVAIWGRRGIPESHMFLEQQKEEQAGASAETQEVGLEVRQVSSTRRVKAIVSAHWLNMLIGGGALASTAILQYGGFVWGQSFLAHAGLTADDTMLVGLCSRVVMLVLAMPVGWLADVVGVASVMLIGSLGFMLAGLPLWSMVQRNPQDLNQMMLSLGVGFGVLGSLVGTVPFYFVVELFPTAVRNTAVCICWNVSLSIFGGLAPIVAQVSVSWSPLGPGIMYAVGGFISVLSIQLGLFLQSRNMVQLTHVRKEPYFVQSCGAARGAKLSCDKSESVAQKVDSSITRDESDAAVQKVDSSASTEASSSQGTSPVQV